MKSSKRKDRKDHRIDRIRFIDTDQEFHLNEDGSLIGNSQNPSQSQSQPPPPPPPPPPAADSINNQKEENNENESDVFLISWNQHENEIMSDICDIEFPEEDIYF